MSALANRDGMIVSMLRATRVGCDGGTALTSRVIASKSVGSRSAHGKCVINALTSQSPLLGRSILCGERSIITSRPPDSTHSKISLLSTFVKGNLVPPTMTTVAGFGPVELSKEEVDSRQRATS